MKFNSTFLGCALLLGLGCGEASSGNKNDAPVNPNQQATPDKPEANPKSSARLGEGKYFISAGTVEAFDNAGNKIDPQTLQITGDYTWIVKSLGSEKYEVTATGSAKISSSNQVIAEVNCKGAQDVFAFTLLTSNALRELAIIESGCPQGIKAVGSQQMSINPVSDSTFVYTVASQEEGARVIESYTFRK
jgi:hypothetical protein